MLLEQMLPALREGKKVRRICWPQHQWISISKDTLLDQDKDDYPIEVVDIIATDWEVLECRVTITAKDIDRALAASFNSNPEWYRDFSDKLKKELGL